MYQTLKKVTYQLRVYCRLRVVIGQRLIRISFNVIITMIFFLTFYIAFSQNCPRYLEGWRFQISLPHHIMIVPVPSQKSVIQQQSFVAIYQKLFLYFCILKSGILFFPLNCLHIMSFWGLINKGISSTLLFKSHNQSRENKSGLQT